MSLGSYISGGGASRARTIARRAARESGETLLCRADRGGPSATLRRSDPAVFGEYEPPRPTLFLVLCSSGASQGSADSMRTTAIVTAALARYVVTPLQRQGLG